MTDANAIMYVSKGPAYLQRKEQRNLSTDEKNDQQFLFLFYF